MSGFLIESPDGKRKPLTLEELSRNLCLNGILYEVSRDSEKGIGFINHKTLVFFAYTWEAWALETSKTKPPETVEALRLVGLWLEDSESVSNEELQAAARAAAGAARAAARAARAAWAAAEAATWAAWVAAWAARAAGDTSEAAWAAAGAAAYQKQGEFILAHLKSNRSLWDL
jgi:hypothetical protein